VKEFSNVFSTLLAENTALLGEYRVLLRECRVILKVCVYWLATWRGDLWRGGRVQVCLVFCVAECFAVCVAVCAAVCVAVCVAVCFAVCVRYRLATWRGDSLTFWQSSC